MVRFELVFATFILASSVQSYPEQPLNKRPDSNRRVIVTSHRLNLKFPNNHKSPSLSSQVPVRTPQGSWSLETSPSHHGDRTNSEEIVFPDEVVVEEERKFVPKIGKRSYPECAKGDTFCETVDDYPVSHLRTILQDTGPQFRNLFGNDSVEPKPTLTHRIEGIDEHPLCGAEETIVYPKTAMNKDNHWLFIINQGEYTQGVRIEKCVNANTPCQFHASFPSGYKTTCKQKYIYRRLLAVSGTGKPITDTFQLPSCCMCMVSGIDIAAKFGDGTFGRQQQQQQSSKGSKPASKN